MGYWEQLGEENRKHHEKRAAMHPLRRKLSDGLGKVFIIAASIALWALVLAPLWDYSDGITVAVIPTVIRMNRNAESKSTVLSVEQ